MLYQRSQPGIRATHHLPPAIIACFASLLTGQATSPASQDGLYPCTWLPAHLQSDSALQPAHPGWSQCGNVCVHPRSGQRAHEEGGKWGSEEKKRSMPFRKGAAFELVFMVQAEHYKVVVNGNPFYEFGHRLPLQMVTHLQVDGDVELQSINFIGGNPRPGQTSPGTPVYPTMEGPPIFNPPVPFRKSLQGGLTARRTIIIKGSIPAMGKSFVINFMVGSSGDLALHINPRLTEGLVIRNSYLNGSWGSEDRKISYNPFGPGQFFDLSIRCGIDRFKVYANSQHLFDYPHRLSAFQNVDVLEIQGDITLSYVQV
ncbi:galectin-4 isoform X1 [Eumetopias jubatus]|uniref:galectin-4 isoform X1 n=1 Tax=Eumetopias jubatus TaxID=34886 RepID=UPI001016E7BF|nr:galectin-4 isoform X1 [Eumetopias jubatus]